MDALVKEIQTSLIDLVGRGVEALPGVAIAIVVLLLTRFGANMVRKFTATLVGRALRNRSLRSLLTKVSYISAWIVGIVTACILAFPNLALSDIIALLGLGSVAVGFAFQDIFKNFLAGILLLLQEPFRLGDQVIINDYEGTVEEIALRSTQIRTYQGEEVVIPNSIVFTSPVQVLTARPHRRTDLSIGVDYNTPLPKAVHILHDSITSVQGVLQQPAPEVDIVGFGDSSIDLIVRYWTPPEQKDVRRIKTNAMIALKQSCDEADISIPYPIRTLYYYDQQKYSDYLPNTDRTQGSNQNGHYVESNN